MILDSIVKIGKFSIVVKKLNLYKFHTTIQKVPKKFFFRLCDHYSMNINTKEKRLKFKQHVINSKNIVSMHLCVWGGGVYRHDCNI